MVKIKTRELIGSALDWAVAKAEGLLEPREYLGKMITPVVIDPEFWADDGKPIVRLNPCPQVYYDPEYAPSKKWAQGGPIIEREKISVVEKRGKWVSHVPLSELRIAYLRVLGPTPLIAAMRCYVASKLGEEVEIPKELVNG